MKIQPADVLDRLSIVMLYMIHGHDHVVLEYEALLNEVRGMDVDQRLADFAQLLMANANVWKLESEIRKGKEGEMGLEEVGRRAIQIREFNKARVCIKDHIANYMGGFRHMKVDHISA